MPLTFFYLCAKTTSLQIEKTWYDKFPKEREAHTTCKYVRVVRDGFVQQREGDEKTVHSFSVRTPVTHPQLAWNGTLLNQEN